MQSYLKIDRVDQAEKQLKVHRQLPALCNCPVSEQTYFRKFSAQAMC